jgi:diguanylate cyclase (GGDEF)-like protein/PAS domain S-box-containing protein
VNQITYDFEKLRLENERLKERLLKSEERYRKLYEENPSMYFTVDAMGTIMSVNSCGAKQLGYSVGELIGKSVQMVFHPDDHQTVTEQLRECLRGPEKLHQWDLRKIRKDNTVIWVRESARVFNGDEEKVLIMIVCEDVTENKRVQESIKKAYDELETRVREKTSDLVRANESLQAEIRERERKETELKIINSITQAMNQSIDLDDVFRIALDKVVEQGYVDIACIYLLDYAKNEAVLQDHRGFPDDFLQRASRIPKPKGVTWKVINSGEILNVRNASEDADVGPAGRDLGFRSMLGIPINLESKTIGVIWLLSYTERVFTKPEVELLVSIGDQIAIAVARANLYRELTRKNRYQTIIATVTRSVHQSIDLQDVLENAVESMSNNIEGVDNVSIYMVEGKEAVAKAYRGYPKWFMDQIGRIPYPKGFTWKTIIDGKPRYVSNTENDKVIGSAGLKVGTRSYAAMPIHFEGETIGSININSFDEELKLLGIVAQQIELAINNAQHAEALRESEQRYRNFVETARDMIFTLSPAGTFTSLNPVTETITGWSRDEWIGRHFAQIIHPDDIRRAMQIFGCVMKGEMPPIFEMRIQNNSGEYLTVESIVTPQIKNGKVVGLLGISRDVTERKKIEEALRKSEERLNYIFDNTPNVAIQGYDIDGRVMYWNKAAEKIFGWSKNEAIGKTLDKLILDEETTHEFHSILKKITETNKPYGPSEWKFINCEGREGTVYSTIFPIPSSSGKYEFICMDIDITERKRQEAQIHHMAMHDSLTDLPNRRALQEKLEYIISKSDRRKTHAFVAMDLDNFKLINDTLGHLQADQVLVDLAKIMRKTMRPEDLLARVGGDEFAMVIQNVSRDEAKTIAERFYSAINRYSSYLKGYSFQIGISIGINLFDGKTDPQMIMAIAYSALAAAKYEGKNRVIIYHSEEYNRVELNQASQWCIRINDAVRENRLILQFQPVIRLDNREALYMEALVRMRDAGNKTVMPKAFIPAAERFGLMSKIDKWVVEKVINSVDKDNGVRTFVNLSGSSLRDESLLEFIENAVKGNRRISSHIGFEITEFTNITNMDRLNQWMIDLRETGCQFALDDFGMGYFSFAHLLKLPVDFVKIESSFIQSIDTDQTSSAIVKAIITVSRLMGKEVIAEGVETESVANILSRLKIKYGQGNYWRKPSDDITFIY